jgi:putative addiction module component (TIGR02574 family)
MILEQLTEVQALSPWEKLVLVGELWDDLAEHPSEIPVDREIMADLDKRLAEYEADPDAASKASSWDEVRARIQASRK